MESLKEKEVAIHYRFHRDGDRRQGSVEVLQDGETAGLGPFDNVVLAGGMRPVNGLAASWTAWWGA